MDSIQTTSSVPTAPALASSQGGETAESLLSAARACGSATVSSLGAESSAALSVFQSIGELLGKLGTLLARVLEQLTDRALPPGGQSAPRPSETQVPAPASSAPSLGFSEKLKLVLTPDSENRVSEAELRRGVVSFQLYQKSSVLSDRFEERYEALVDDGIAKPLALEKALIGLVASGDLSRADANWIFSLSHRAAQLDGRPETVDTSGEKGAVLPAAIHCAEATLAGIQAGNIAVEPRTL